VKTPGSILTDSLTIVAAGAAMILYVLIVTNEKLCDWKRH